MPHHHITMSAKRQADPLRSRKKDHRLIGGSNNIRYSNDTLMSSASVGLSKGSEDGISISSESSGSSSSLESATEVWARIDARRAANAKRREALAKSKALEERGDLSSADDDSSTSSVLLIPHASPSNNNDAAAGVGSKRPPNVVMVPAPAANGKVIRQIYPPLQSAIESRLGAKEDTTSTTHSADKLLTNMNILIGNKASIVKAAGMSSQSLKKRVLKDIPDKRYVQKTRKSVIAAAMAKAWSSLCELLHDDNNNLTRAVEKDVSVFITILEGAQMYCLEKLESERNRKAKGFKTVQLSSDKLGREYGKCGGKPSALKCPKCNHTLCDKEPDFDENAKENKSITRDWKEDKKYLEEYNPT